MLLDHLQKTKKEYKNLKKQKIRDTFIKSNYVKQVFETTWLIKILNIELEEQLLIKYPTIDHSKLLKIRSMMDININLFHWSSCANNFAGGEIKNKNTPNKELAEELHKTIIRKIKKRKVHAYFIDNIYLIKELIFIMCH